MTQDILTRDDMIQWIQACARAMSDHRQELTDLDAAIGDADHGANMDRGFRAVLARLPSLADQDIATLLKTVGMTLLSTVGGASGPLYGTFFLQAAQAAPGGTALCLADWLAMLEAGVKGIASRGKAVAGDKTMIDALEPAVQALRRALAEGAAGEMALAQCAQAARQGAEATLPLVARKGRASYLGDRSAGHQDPGATSAWLLLDAAARSWSGS